jgi:D-sedoheptulose 7-phosphate isomerase
VRPARRRKARPSPSARRRRGATRVATSPDTVAAAHAALREAAHALGALEHAAALPLAEAIEVVMATLESGGTVYFCGNGGSAADAQHFACELAGRFTMERPALAAVALTTNTSSLTAIGNDFGYEQVFSRQLEGLGVAGDVLIAITTSGASASVVRAVEAAHQLGMTVIGMTGRRGARFAALCDVALVTPHESTPRVQEGHLLLGHALCALVERGLFASRAGGRTGRARGARRGGAARR